MDRLTLKVAARYAVVVPFKPKSGVPTIAIGGKHYVLSTDGGPLGDSSDPHDHGMMGYGEPEEGHGARLIQGPEHSVKWRFLWAYDTEKQQIAMWRITDGNEKHYGPAHSEQGRIVSLGKRGELNRVTSSEMGAIEREMRKKANDEYEKLKEYLEESKTDFNRQVDRLAEEFFQHHVKAKLDKAVSDVERGVVPFGFKPFGPAGDEHARKRQLLSHVVGQVFAREMSKEKFEAYVREKGLDPEEDLQTVHWAIDEVYERHLPPYEGP